MLAILGSEGGRQGLLGGSPVADRARESSPFPFWHADSGELQSFEFGLAVALCQPHALAGPRPHGQKPPGYGPLLCCVWRL